MKPLDLEKLADELIRVEYPTYEKSQIEKAVLSHKNLMKNILKQRIKLACGFYREWWNNPKQFIMWYEDKKKVDELSKLLEDKFGEYWQDEYDYLIRKRIEIILEYNDWLFELTFKDILGDKNG